MAGMTSSSFLKCQNDEITKMPLSFNIKKRKKKLNIHSVAPSHPTHAPNALLSLTQPLSLSSGRRPSSRRISPETQATSSAQPPLPAPARPRRPRRRSHREIAPRSPFSLLRPPPFPLVTPAKPSLTPPLAAATLRRRNCRTPDALDQPPSLLGRRRSRLQTSSIPHPKHFPSPPLPTAAFRRPIPLAKSSGSENRLYLPFSPRPPPIRPTNFADLIAKTLHSTSSTRSRPSPVDPPVNPQETPKPPSSSLLSSAAGNPAGELRRSHSQNAPLNLLYPRPPFAGRSAGEPTENLKTALFPSLSSDRRRSHRRIPPNLQPKYSITSHLPTAALRRSIPPAKSPEPKNLLISFSLFNPPFPQANPTKVIGKTF